MKVGERVLYAGTQHKATVRFIGKIDGQEFVGIEYDSIDDQFKGKYDGTYNGVEYFKCPANYGAFVKQKKLYRSLEALIEEKYAGYRTATETMQISDGMLDKDIEFKGIAMIDRYYAQLSRLESVSVQNCGFIEDFGVLAYLIPMCRFLDLSGNQVYDEVFLAFKYLPELTCIDVSGSFVALGFEVAAELESAGITRSCSVFMNEIQANGVYSINLLCKLPFVREVLMNNVQMDLSYLAGSETLESVYLNYACTGMQFVELERFLRRFPRLTALSLAGCLGGADAPYKPYFCAEQLKTLSLAKSNISLQTLLAIYAMTPNLQSFKVSAVDGMSEEAMANTVIGLFGQTIRYFNAGEVKQRYIADCEIYLCNFMLRQPEFSLQPGIILELVKKHQIQVPHAKCRLLDEQERYLVEIVEDTTQRRENESEDVAAKFNYRIIKIKYGKDQAILAAKITPMWHLRYILREKGVKATWLVCENRREALDSIGKYEELYSVVSGFVCSVQ